ncbi:hypothetical protein J3B01_002298 [Coemansia erecta]|nr:hypothetical protein IWW49_002587 [Coemansia sp. RSA 1797]KAJ2837204.1 hypothetical protein J3B01_002298 [Coemansia erecta]
MDVDTSDAEHTQVHGMTEQTNSNGSGEDSEYEEEEFYIVASLPPGAISQAKAAANTNDKDADGEQGIAHCALIDVDSDSPLLELEGSIYRGVKDELLGSTMLFDIEVNEAETENMDAKLLGITSQVISFHPVKFSKR